MAEIISGTALSATIRSELKCETDKLKAQGIVPGLAVVLVGEDPASKVYVRNKTKACEEIGFYHEQYNLPATITEHEILDLVDTLNHSDKIHGILIQAPLPKGLDFKNIINHISPEKDVDAFHPVNVGKITIGDFDFLPCTPAGVMELIHTTGISVEGKNCVVVGRSNIVGKPQAMLLLKENGTVTICHSKTPDLAQFTKNADILVAAAGKAGLIRGDMIKPGSIVIDVGMNRNEEGKLVGDVDFASAEPVAGFITPVPGGVGPMTITMLMKNTLRSARNHGKNKNL
ncbi:MAG: bifunctional methylenetetrahydrofolate dehydrogenase/methenyltetrahydrofolate cyclohydrolase FolD [Clostridia bacterium]|nr:bifunctional methylenetetrahydrofolate dehydrogenase/methenyltetrahydrofolate cyclohydrolase FolD [Clostridia bacterium]